MTVVKFSTVKKAPIAIMRYLQKDPANKDRTLAFDSLGMGTNEGIDKAWRAIREAHGKDSQVKLYECMLSFNPKDSAVKSKMSNEQILDYSRKFIAQHAPGQEHAVYIHSDRDHKHAHIIFNSVHSECGNKFRNDAKALHKARESIQELDREYGLKVTLKPEDKSFKRSKNSVSVGERRIKDRDVNAYVWKDDLKEMILNSFKNSNDYPDFVNNLSLLNVNIQLRGKNSTATYSFTDKRGISRKARESSLGPDIEAIDTSSSKMPTIPRDPKHYSYHDVNNSHRAHIINRGMYERTRPETGRKKKRTFEAIGGGQDSRGFEPGNSD
ncbi:MAG: hypothetical protein EOP04_29835, partial [Proteobacteria bacterium]